MAELLISPFVRPIVSTLMEKASSYLLEQYKVMEGMEEQHEILMRKLPAILDVITDAEEKAAQREGARAWLQALKKVAYEANDAFDEFKYEALRRKARKDGHYGKLGLVDTIKLFPSHNRIAFRYRMGNKLSKIVQKIEVLVREMNDFRFTYHPQQRQVSQEWRQKDHDIQDPMNIAERSRRKDIENVVAKLLGQASNADLAVIPIVGMGGLGKTTLAQLVFHDPQVQEHFQLRLWVCVPDNFDVYSVARSIVEAATNKKDDTPSPLDRLQKEVSAQRYLLVLDDVWKTGITFSDKWEKLKARLQHGGIGSAVLTTTRDGGVAQAMGTVEAYNLTALEKSFIEETIKTRAFGVQKEGKPGLIEMVGEIADRCRGSPLAATALGSVLRTKTSVEEWEAVLSKSTICNEETGILPILKLSYNDLPSHMKQCFAFCAVFPKDYEIDVDEMIQLWMAHGFIPERKEDPPETTGQQIFSELASRSFFQDVKYVPVNEYESIHGYCPRITCKMHDLMHDVAESVMQKECVTIAERPSQTELFPSTARHLFLTCKDPETLLNDSKKKTSPAIQTLLCPEFRVDGSLQQPSKYRSVRALQLCQNRSTFLLKPKHLRHLRYLDLSYSYIQALPEDISILYNLQTLNLSGCFYLCQLPRQMVYMNALRHLYTDRCIHLKCIPPNFSQLTSLQTLTCFVVGTDSDCSNLRELQHLNLCGRLELSQLENVTGADAKVANLGNKKKLRELTLTWTSEEEKQHNDMVLENLEPHDMLQALRICRYQGTTFPEWKDKLLNLVELHLSGCKKLEKLPPLCQLRELQLLSLRGLAKLEFLCSGDTSFTFPKLKELKLKDLLDFQRWLDGRQGAQIMFPQLEKLSIEGCKTLTALPEARSISAFPELKLILLADLDSLKMTEGTDSEHASFPNLEDARIWRCPKLTGFPQAPKLSALDIDSGNQQIYLRAARYLTSLSNLKLKYNRGAIELPADLVDGKEKQNHKSPLSIMSLDGCNFLFCSSALGLWKCFVQLQDLSIVGCDGLVHWPEREFQSLVSLRILSIYDCCKLAGYAQPPDQSTSERSQLLPCLESLEIKNCESLVEIFNVAASLKRMEIWSCPVLELKFRKQAASLESIDQVEQQEQSAVIQPDTDILPSTDVPRLPPSATELFLPCLESLELHWCYSISELLNLPSTLTHIKISHSHKIGILSGQLDALQELTIYGCKTLRSLESCSGELPLLKSLKLYYCDCLAAIPNGPQAYTSLQSLTIINCHGIKSLPTCLQQRLHDLKQKDIDAIEGPRLSKPKTWKYAICRSDPWQNYHEGIFPDM